MWLPEIDNLSPCISADVALKEAAFIVNMMLANRPEVRAAMIKSGARLCIMGHNEYTTDLPEFARLAEGKAPGCDQVSAKDFWDARARGMGGSETDPYCSTGEENLLGYPGDPYSKECILIHEFAHNMHLRGMVNADPAFDGRLKAAYEAAMKVGLWKGKYAALNHHEYFAVGVAAWYGTTASTISTTITSIRGRSLSHTIPRSPRCAAKCLATTRQPTPSPPHA